MTPPPLEPASSTLPPSSSTSATAQGSAHNSNINPTAPLISTSTTAPSSALDQTTLAAHKTESYTSPRATSDHPPQNKPDPTVSVPDGAAQRRQSSTSATSSAELASLKINLRSGLRQSPDFPTPGVLFEDILPLFASPSHHADLIRALELQLKSSFPAGIDVLVGLEARGFLFAPTLALRLNASFVPVRKKGKLPGPCETASFQKEYGADHFQMQSDAIRSGQRVVILDDIIATGGSASAAGSLVRQLGGDLLGYVFLMELDFLKGRAKLDAPVYTLLSGQEEALRS